LPPPASPLEELGIAARPGLLLPPPASPLEELGIAARPGLLLPPPAAPLLQLGFGGTFAVNPNPPVAPAAPGLTCATAGAIVAGTTYTFTIAPGTANWFTLPISSSGTYHLRVNSVSGFGTNGNFSTGACPSPGPAATVFGAGCSAASLTGPATVLVWFLTFAFSGVTYSFIFDAGTC
jgi:hypothetical protein